MIPQQEENRARIGAYVHRVMVESHCKDYEWAEQWLWEQRLMQGVLAGGWTLEDIMTMDVAQEAEKMVAALWKNSSESPPHRHHAALMVGGSLS